MINPFAKQTNDQLNQILHIINQLYNNGQSDMEQLKSLRKKGNQDQSSLNELLQTEHFNSEQFLQIQQIAQQIQQQLQQEYDPENAVSKWN